MKIRTIKGRITVWFSILFLILSSGVMAFLFLVGRSTVHNSTRDRLFALVEANADELEYMEPWKERDEDEGDHYLPWKEGTLEIDDDFSVFSGGVSVALYSGQDLLFGRRPEGAEPDSLPPADRQLQTVKYKGVTYLVYDAELYDEELKGLWLRGMVNKQEDVSVLLRVSRFMLFALPVLTLIAVYGGYQLAKKALKPLSDISEQADSIGSGVDLSRRIEFENADRETERLANAFNAMFERLRQSFEAEKEFTSDASHELRTPVAVILAECEYALEEEDAGEWREALEVIARQGKKMSRMIEDLLTFTRIERGLLGVKQEELRLDEAVLEVCREQELIWKREICLHTELEPLRVFGDRGLLEQLIRNLVSNAYKYGREPGNIWVRVFQEEGHVTLSVKDDGAGIREEDLPHIWNRFYRADPARRAGDSTGLGLSMVRQIALIHHAETKVFSKIGEGSTFLIFF